MNKNDVSEEQLVIFTNDSINVKTDNVQFTVKINKEKKTKENKEKKYAHLYLHFDLPDHKEDLKKASAKKNYYRKRLDEYVRTRTFTKSVKERLLEYTHRLQDVVGEYTDPLFALRTVMEDEYYKNKNIFIGFDHKEIYLSHYSKIHKSYDKVKDELFKLIAEIESTKINCRTLY